jgi:hypothetical protein
MYLSYRVQFATYLKAIQGKSLSEFVDTLILGMENSDTATAIKFFWYFFGRLYQEKCDSNKRRGKNYIARPTRPRLLGCKSHSLLM